MKPSSELIRRASGHVNRRKKKAGFEGRRVCQGGSYWFQGVFESILVNRLRSMRIIQPRGNRPAPDKFIPCHRKLPWLGVGNLVTRNSHHLPSQQTYISGSPRCGFIRPLRGPTCERNTQRYNEGR